MTPPTYLAYNVPPEPDVSPYPPYPEPDLYTPPWIYRPHSSIQGGMWEARHPARSRFVLYSPFSNGTPPGFSVDGLEDAAHIDLHCDDSSALVEDCWAWLQEVLLDPDVAGPDGDPVDDQPDPLIADYVTASEQEEVEVRWFAQPELAGHLFVQGFPLSGGFGFHSEVPFILDAAGRALLALPFAQDETAYHVTARFPARAQSPAVPTPATSSRTPRPSRRTERTLSLREHPLPRRLDAEVVRSVM